jgi:Retroviral aspartyl protease
LFGEKERVVTSKILSDIPFGCKTTCTNHSVDHFVNINNTFFSQPVVALIDSGSQSTLIQKRVLPKTLQVSPSSKSLLGVTGQGSLIGEVLLTNFMLPEPSPTNRIDSSLMAGVIDNQATYDVVLGLDFLCQFKIDNLNSTQEIQWLDHKLEYHPRDTFSNGKSLFLATFESLAQVNHSAHDPEDQAAILDAEYEQIDTNHLAEQQFHLNRSQRRDLANLLEKFTKLFDGTLGVYPHKKMHLELIQATCSPTSLCCASVSP